MADLSISTFKGQFISGARPNLYEVRIAELGAQLEFMAKAASLPASNIEQVEVPYMGRSIKVAGNRTFADWTVTVINDVDFAIRKQAEAWMAKINSHENNDGEVDISGYMRDATVRQLDQSGAVVYNYDFKNIWPTEISEISLGFEENNTIEEFTITFAVGSFWTSDAT